MKKAMSQRSTSVDEKDSSQVPKVDLDGRRTKLSMIRGCRQRRVWKVLLLCHLMICFSAAIPPDLHLEPSVRYYTVWEGEFQQVDCYGTLHTSTDDLLWEKLHSPPGNYIVEKKIENNTENTFTIHSIMTFKSFTSSDAGIYKCSYRPYPGYGSEISIKLEFHERCEAGNYGLGCSSNCSEFCKEINTSGKESPCNYKDGHCLHGCLPGYQGANCSSVCGRGRFGPDCSLLCSEFCKGYGSLDKSWCHPKTGICVDGCQDGHNGTFCTTYIAEHEDNSVTEVVLAVALTILGLILIMLYIIHRNSKRLYLCIKRKLQKPQPSTRSVNEEESVHLGSSNDII